MPVDSTHDSFDWWLPEWTKIRDAVGGQPYVKAPEKAHIYLPVPSGMVNEPENYTNYLALATFLGASSRSLRGLVGTMLRKPISGLDTIPSILTPRLTNIDRRGTSLEAMIKLSVRELIQQGRVGILVDKPATNVTDLPYVVPYEAEQIIDWQEQEQLDAPEVLSHVRLQDSLSMSDPEDLYQQVHLKRVRVLALDAEGHYTMELHQENAKHEMKQVDETRTPNFRGTPLTFLPFYFFNPDGDTSPNIQAPPLLDLVNENMAHYRTSADAEHVRHLTGCPTPWIADTGAQESSEPILLGGLNCIKLGTGGHCGFLGLTGQEMVPQMDSLKMRQENMAMLGSRLLEPQRAAIEAAATHQLRQSGETATLVDIALSISKGWTQILKWMAWWAGASDAAVQGITISLSTDFVPGQMTAQYLTALVGALQAGRISQDTFLWNLAEGESLPPTRSIQEEILLIEEDRKRNPPPPAALPPLSGNGNQGA